MTTKAAPVLQLELPRSTHAQAKTMAKLEGLSLEEFIMIAIAEKLAAAETLLQRTQYPRSRKVVSI